MSRVLVVDDERQIRFLLRTFLEEMGYTVLCAADGASAIEVFESDPVDVVLTDLLMPEIDGMELLALLHQRAPELPVVVITGMPSIETAVQSVREGAFDYLSKPITKEQLQRVVANAVEVKRLKDEKKALETENRAYREKLEETVAKKTNALRERERWFRSLVEATSDWIWAMENDWVFSYTSPKVSDVLGVDPDDVIGAALFSHIHDEDRNRVRDALAVAKRDRAPFSNLQYTAVHRQGHYVVLESAGVPYFDDDGACIGYRGITRDITQRRRTEDALRVIIESTASVFGDDFFRALVRNLASALHVDGALIAIFVQGENGVDAEPVAVWTGDGFEEGERYPTQGTPAAGILEGGTLVCPQRVTEVYPLTAHLRAFGAESYIGAPLTDTRGTITGHLAIFDTKPLADKRVKRSLVQLFAARASGVLERQRAEERILRSLEEKEVLLKEIHHRVKNNLQIISSLLNLEMGQIDDERTRGFFYDAQNRIRAMALIHEKLYQSSDLSNVDLKAYVEGLVTFLYQSHAIERSLVDICIDVDDISLSIDLAIPCGLIINELISNALQHAFPGDANGRIVISMHKASDNGQRYLLCIEDDGVGFPEDIDFRNSESLGLQLVATLGEQLNAEIALERTEGTRFEILYPASQFEDER